MKNIGSGKNNDRMTDVSHQRFKVNHQKINKTPITPNFFSHKRLALIFIALKRAHCPCRGCRQAGARWGMQAGGRQKRVAVAQLT